MQRYLPYVVLLLMAGSLIALSPGVHQATASTARTNVLADFTPRDLDVELQGSGTTMLEPLYDELIQDYQEVAQDVDIDYRGVGSEQGIADFVHAGYDFAATDSVIESSELDDDHLYVPILVAPLVISYNRNSLDIGDTPLKFSGKTLAGIFSGEISRWNDEAIAEENPRHDLPDEPITVIYRTDGSGASSLLTSYLDTFDPDTFNPTEQFDPPADQRVGVEGNAEAARTINSTDGAIGYVAYYYAIQENLPLSRLQNQTSNKWIRPSQISTSFAAQDARYADRDPSKIINETHEYAYPLAGFTWLVIERFEYDRKETAEALTDFIYWTFEEEQQRTVLQEGFTPLPDEGKDKAIDQLEKVQVDDEEVFDRP